jgi:hypothetical protein
MPGAAAYFAYFGLNAGPPGLGYYSFDLGAWHLVGHDHDYERFAPQDPEGRADPARGIREFVAGTGGAPPYQFSRIAANSEARLSGQFGVAQAHVVGTMDISGISCPRPGRASSTPVRAHATDPQPSAAQGFAFGITATRRFSLRVSSCELSYLGFFSPMLMVRSRSAAMPSLTR